ncbi:hypothetical protein BT93_F0004 [Corymbia citriodora subsp. variegata]|nr:hypothetical protein BT93_F0004 [Corymbia citriodora subsp. variegata]
MAPCYGLVSTFLLALLVIQVIDFGHSISSTNVSYIGAEREALLKFKHGFSDPWRRLSLWISEDCCKWEGIRCDEKTGHVLKLDLHNPCIEDIDMLEPSNKCRLGGNIVPSLTELKYLKYLDLSVNNFSAQKIPTFLASLQKLEYLNLSYAGFNGDIPRQLNNLSKLQYLDLSNDFILGHLYSNDLDWLSKFSSLRYLHMSGVGLSKAKDWPISPLRFLTIKSNNLSYIPPWTYNLSKLEHIDLSDNFHIKGPFPIAIIENNQRLAFFDVSLDSLQGEFPKNMSSLCKLQVVRLSNNYFNGKISVISNGPHGCVWSKWKIFDVSGNNFSGDLPNQFGDFKEVEFLDLSLNSISGSIPTNLGELSSLRELHLYNNKLSGTILESIGNINSLTMSNASISYDIPDWLYDISANITHLDISSNVLTGQVSQDIGDKMPRLTVLRLWGNNLTGGISSSLCKLDELDEINLSKNQLSGRLPRCWRASQKLKALVFENNKLNGNIPKSLCHLQQLQVLSFHRNGFSGVIPNCLSNLQQMVFFYLSNNGLTGRLHPFGKHFQSLAMINLEKNHFVGGIPLKFCQLHYLRFLSLAQNNISGPIPNCIDGFLSMVDSTLYYEDWPYEDGLNVMVNTKGTSQMYEEFTRLVELQNMNLSQNNVSGHIPSNIGTIPPGISNMNFLSHLNLSFNKLSGPIPSGNHLCTVDDKSICPGDEPPGRDGRKSDNSSEGNLDIHNWFYAGLGPGFTMGFLGFCSILHFNQSWRISYFRAMDRAFEEFSMTMMITMLWLKRKIQQRE